MSPDRTIVENLIDNRGFVAEIALASTTFVCSYFIDSSAGMYAALGMTLDAFSNRHKFPLSERLRELLIISAAMGIGGKLSGDPNINPVVDSLATVGGGLSLETIRALPRIGHLRFKKT